MPCAHFLKMGSHVVQAVLELTIYLRKTLTNSYLHFPSARSQAYTTVPSLCGAGNPSQGFVYAKQSAHQLKYIPSSHYCC